MQTIRIDFDNPGLPQSLGVVEGESQSRIFQAALYKSGAAYTAPAGAVYSIMYRGFGPQNQGWYDTIEDGAGKRAACTVSGNVVTCELARQALRVPGHLTVVLCVSDAKGYMLKSWPIMADVRNDGYEDTVEIEMYFNLSSIAGNYLTQLEKALADAEQTKKDIDAKAAAALKSIPEEYTELDGSVKQLKEDIDNYGLIFERVNLFNKNKIKNDVINNQDVGSSYGSFIALNNYFSSELIEIKPNDKLFVWGSFDTPGTSYVTFYSDDKKVVSSSNGIGVHTIAPESAVYFSVSAAKTKLNTLMAYKEQPTKYYSYNYVRSGDDKLKEVNVNLYNGETVRGYYCDKNLAMLNALENAVTSLPIVVHGKTKISYRNDGDEGFGLYFYDEDYNKINVVWCGKKTKNVIDIPADAFYIRFYAINTLSNITIVFGDKIPTREYSTDEVTLNIKEVNDISHNNTDYLYNKKIVFDGDSITEGAGVTDIAQGLPPNDNKGFGYWIQQNHPTSVCYGYAKSGWKVARRTDTNDSLLMHIPLYPADVDCFILSGGYNDQATQIAIGELVKPTDGVNAYFNASFDEYTFIGALESWFKQLRIKYPDATIVYVLTPKRIYSTNPVFNNDSKGVKVKDVLYSTGYERMKLFWNSIKEVCKKWSIKFLDLSETCGIVGTGELTGDGLDANKRYFKLDTDGNPDFTHPNTFFYKTFIVPQVENLLKSVLD